LNEIGAEPLVFELIYRNHVIIVDVVAGIAIRSMTDGRLDAGYAAA
jgi:hypothetical protein